PLLARHLAGLAPDADRGVGEEALARGGVLPPGVRGGVGGSRELAGEVAHHRSPSASGASVGRGAVAARCSAISGSTSSSRSLAVSAVLPARDWYSATRRISSSPCGR